MTPSMSLRSRLGAFFAVACLLAALLPSSAAAVAPTGAPTGLSPTGTSVDFNPTFSWNGVPGAVRYRVQVATVGTFASTVYSADTTERVATPTADLPLGTLYWRVAAMDGSNNLGPWADTQFAKTWTASPNPIAPANNAQLSFPTEPLLFRWEPLAGAQSYELQVDDANDFIGASSFTTKNTSYVITEPKTSGQSFFWRVRGISTTAGVTSGWSDVRTASVVWPGKPTLIYPLDGATVDAGQAATACPTASVDGTAMGCDLYFEWSPVLGAKTYQLQVSANADWAYRTIDITVKGTRYAPPTGLNNGNYYWRVRALDAANTPNYGPWSDVGLVVDQVFERAWSSKPTLLGPADHSIMATPTFSWTPVDHAAYYELEISTDQNFLETKSYSCYTNRSQWTPYILTNGLNVNPPDGCEISLNPGITYYWHVRGIDAPVLNAGATYNKGILGRWSNTSNTDVWQFEYEPVVPDYVSPADRATVSVPTLKWTEVAGATRYKVTIVKASGGVAASADTYSASWTPTAKLQLTDSPFKWYVQSYDINGKLSAYVDSPWQRSFTLTDFTATGSTPELDKPDGDARWDMPPMDWTAVAGASRYQVMYSLPGSTTDFTLGTPTDYPAYTYPSAVLPSGTYEWYVKALNSSGGEISRSSSRYLFTVSELNVVPQSDYLTPPPCSTPPSCTPVADTPTLSWRSQPGALWYRIYVSLDQAFTNIYRTYDTAYTTLSPRDSWLDNQANSAYYVFVRPIRSDNTGRFDTAAQAFAISFQKRSEGIHLNKPADNAIVPDQVTFSWQDFLASNQALVPPVTQEARQYQIQVSTVQDFNTLLDDKTVDQTFFTAYDRTYPEGPLFWRVRAIDGSGNQLTWSPVEPIVLRPRTLKKESPPITLQLPDNAGTVSGVPYFTWAPQEFAASYDIEIARNGDMNFGGSNRVVLGNTKMSAYAYNGTLAPGSYAWRVRRVDADGKAGPWTDPDHVRLFYLTPGAPVLDKPDHLSTVTSLATFMFTWSSPQAYPKYTIETSISPSFASIYESKTTVMMRWAPLATYADNTYFWRVKALNADGTVIAVSSAAPVWQFTVKASPIVRYYGADRYATAAAISANTFPANCGCTAYIAYALNFPDALAGAAAAGTVKGPVLLADTNGAINASTVAELTRLQPTKIVVLGSAGVISAAVFSALAPYAGTGGVVRYSDTDRFGTAADISSHTFSPGVPVAYIAYAFNFPDALAGAAAAGTIQGPVLLVNSTGAIDSKTATELGRLHPNKIIVLGSEGVISPAVFNALAPYAGAGGVDRYYGADRFATAADISAHTFSPGVSVAYIAYAFNFPDALAGAAAAGTIKGPVLLVDTNGTINPSTAAELTRLQPQRIIVLGSTGVISDSVKNALAGYVVP